MPRTIWTGSLSFGLVTIPIGLYPATADKTIHFNQFEEGTSDRIRYKKVNERTGEEVEASRIVRGVDLGGGEYVILSDEELAAAEPKRSRVVEITDFVDLHDIDPVYYRTTYYLAPQTEPAAKAYALLVEAMRESGRVAIATLVMRNKEYLVAIRPQQGALALETMYFPDEVRRPEDEIPRMGGVDELARREVDLAKMLVEAMTGQWTPEQYHDTHRRRVEELIEEKRQGHEIVRELETGANAEVVDLMEALQASVNATRIEPAGAGAAAGAATKERPGTAATGGETSSARRGRAKATRKAGGSEGPETGAAKEAASAPAERAKGTGSRTRAAQTPTGTEPARAAKAPRKPGAPLRKVS
jgi:DNA end-binding protein Ku